MVFSSNLFLFGFLPVVLALYFFAPRKFRNLYLFLISLFFYFWGCGPVIFVFLLCVVLNFAAGIWIAAAPRSRARVILTACVVLDLGILIYYKYLNFLGDQVSSILTLASIRWQLPFRIALPIGVSFFVFKAASYPVQVYRGIVPPARNLIDFGTWLSLFPDFIAGPIVRFSEISSEVYSRRSTLDTIFKGMSRFALGLGKKVLIANHVGLVADRIFNLPPGQSSAGLAWLGLICYTFQIYYDFAGYSDMAIGLGLFFGFHFPENFNQPYRSRSVTEFWRRWHMTLSRWFRDFLWFPLGANYRSDLRNYFNVFVVFLLCGFWHGAAWTFVIWGAYYGVLMALELFLRDKWKVKFSGLTANAYAMFMIMIGWVLFRSADLPSAWEYLKLLFGQGPARAAFLYFPPSYYLEHDILFYLGVAILFSWLPVERIEKHPFWRSSCGTALAAACSLVLIAYSAIVLSGVGFNPFIYFRF
jgi:alginate O-acetyltransferase complex protein AlgI